MWSARPPFPGTQRGRCGWSKRPRTSDHDSPAVGRFEERRRFHAAVHPPRIVTVQRDLPDVVDRHAAVGRELHVRLERVRPAPAVVVAASQKRSPVVLRRRPEPPTILAIVVRHRVNRVAVEVRPRHVPLRPPDRRPQDKCAFRGSDEQQHVALVDAQVPHPANHRRRVTGWLSGRPCKPALPAASTASSAA